MEFSTLPRLSIEDLFPGFGQVRKNFNWAKQVASPPRFGLKIFVFIKDFEGVRLWVLRRGWDPALAG